MLFRRQKMEDDELELQRCVGYRLTASNAELGGGMGRIRDGLLTKEQDVQVHAQRL